MAVVQTMALGQQNKMYNVIHSTPQAANCVIVSTAGGLTQPAKSVIAGKRPIVSAASERSSVLVTNNSDLRCKRKIQFMPYSGGPPQQPASVARRNARERNRVKQVNNGFATLRQHIPASVAAAFSPPGATTTSQTRGVSKKLSKVETLRLAVEYIRSLQQMLEDHETQLPLENSDKSPNKRFYSSSNKSNQIYSSYPIILPTPTCSETSTSPTPSQASDGSFSVVSSSYTNSLYNHHAENFENYEPKSPEDEELLDVIFSWQQE